MVAMALTRTAFPRPYSYSLCDRPVSPGLTLSLCRWQGSATLWDEQKWSYGDYSDQISNFMVNLELVLGTGRVLTTADRQFLPSLAFSGAAACLACDTQGSTCSITERKAFPVAQAHPALGGGVSFHTSPDCH